MIISQNIPLKKYSNYKIGGPAEYFSEFKSEEELKTALSEFESLNPQDKSIFVLGGGTNILFPDAGVPGLVLKNSINFIKRDGLNVTAGAGTSFESLLSFCIQNSLSGLEWAGGLPGTVGGATRGNAGAFLGEAGDCIDSVESFSLNSRKKITRSKKECDFGYRQSVFKGGVGKEEVILSTTFELKKGDSGEIKKSTQEKVDFRIDRHPLDLPNIGSTFKNVPEEEVSEKVKKEFEKSIKPDPFPVIPVAKLLIGVDLMGKQIGGAMFSTKHPNFIVNIGGAKASDVLRLVDLAKEKIKEKYDIHLEEEIMVL